MEEKLQKNSRRIFFTARSNHGSVIMMSKENSLNIRPSLFDSVNGKITRKDRRFFKPAKLVRTPAGLLRSQSRRTKSCAETVVTHPRTAGLSSLNARNFATS